MILDSIIEHKKKEVARRKKILPLSSFRNKITRSKRSFKLAISTSFGLIAEIKRASPSKGLLSNNFDLKKIATIYQNNHHVKAVSVLTDLKYFKTGIHSLSEASKHIEKPILRKDFIIDEYQIYEARRYGADAILLIASILGKIKIDRYISIAKKLGMDCLVEVHTKEELKKVLKTKAEIIGINNRNLDTLKIDLNTTIKLAKIVPKGKIIVSESGFKTSADIKKAKSYVNAVLIGTSLIQSKDIDKKIKELMKCVR